MSVAIQGEVLPADAWTPEQAASHVVEAWQDAVESIIETGQRLMEAKKRVGHGQWLPTVDLLPFSERTAQVLMQIAKHPDLPNPQHVAHLPASWGTLGVLAQLPPGEIVRRIEAREITPELERGKAQEWANAYGAAKQEALNAWSDATDALTRALSYARTYQPPDDIPDNYVSVEEFMERLAALQEATQDWSDQ